MPKSEKSSIAKRTPKKEEEMVWFCPKCNSIDIIMDTSNMLVGVAGVPADYICRNCGYTSRVFPEISESEAKDLVVKKNITDKMTEKVDVTYGRFEINIMWRAFGPVFVLLSLYLFMTYSDAQQQMSYVPWFLLVIGILATYFGYRRKDYGT